MSSPRHRPVSVLIVGNYGPSLAVARSLAESGYKVIVGDGGEFATVDRSRYCSEVWRHPQVQDGGAFVSALLGFLERRPEIGILLPLRPRYLELLAANRERMPKHVVLAMAAPGNVEACLDKMRMYQIAHEAGVPYRLLAVATDLPSLIVSVNQVGFPCVVRPVDDTASPMPGQRKAVICRDQAAVERAFITWPEAHRALLVQRFAPGPRHNVHFAAQHGRILARVETMALRTDRLDGTGLGVEGISVRADPRLVKYCDALIKQLDYTGIGLVQFMVTASDEPSFLELNPRHGTALAFIQYCGLDLVNAAIDLAAKDGTWEAPPDFCYPVGKRYAWTSKDIDGLRLARARGEVSRVAALHWLAKAVRAAVKANVHLSWSKRDPMPTIAIYASWIRSSAGRRKPYM